MYQSLFTAILHRLWYLRWVFQNLVLAKYFFTRSVLLIRSSLMTKIVSLNPLSYYLLGGASWSVPLVHCGSPGSCAVKAGGRVIRKAPSPIAHPPVLPPNPRVLLPSTTTCCPLLDVIGSVACLQYVSSAHCLFCNVLVCKVQHVQCQCNEVLCICNIL